MDGHTYIYGYRYLLISTPKPRFRYCDRTSIILLGTIMVLLCGYGYGFVIKKKDCIKTIEKYISVGIITNH